MIGSRMAASSPMIASTQTISSRTSPLSAVNASVRPALNVRRRAGAALLTIRAIRDDVIRSMLARRPVDVRMPPRIVRDRASAQVRPIPAVDAARAGRQRDKAFTGGRIASGIEIEEVERAREAFDLDARGLDLGF